MYKYSIFFLLLLHSTFRSAVLGVLDQILYGSIKLVCIWHWCMSQLRVPSPWLKPRVCQRPRPVLKAWWMGSRGVTDFSCCWPHHKPVTPPHPTATLGSARRLFYFDFFAVFHCHSIWRAETGRGWKVQRNSGGIRRGDLRAWSVFSCQVAVMECHHGHLFKQTLRDLCYQMSDRQHNKQKMTKKWTSHHINHNEVINADGSCRARLVGRVAMVTVGGSEDGWWLGCVCTSANKEQVVAFVVKMSQH